MTACDCLWCAFCRREQQIGTREAAAEYAQSLGITPADFIRVLSEHLHKS